MLSFKETRMDLFNEAVEQSAGRDTTRLKRLDGVYFHGFCSELDDLVYIRGLQPPLSDGVHDVAVYGVRAKMYYWQAIVPYWPGGIRPRGLVVLEGTESELDAKVKFERKQDGL